MKPLIVRPNFFVYLTFIYVYKLKFSNNQLFGWIKNSWITHVVLNQLSYLTFVCYTDQFLVENYKVFLFWL